jgi:GNAT superfamily N-acetyltransferase
MAIKIGSMTRDDVVPAAEAVLAGGWGDRRVFLDFVVDKPFCHPFVATVDGRIVGTGMGTVNGPVGWVGVVFVSPDHRGRGLGQALTAAAIDSLEGAGCRTLVLVATEMGRPMYERLGFRLSSHYQVYVAPGLSPGPADPTIRPIRKSDLSVITSADRLATGEDRARLLAAVVEAGTGWLLTTDRGERRGHIIRAPWGGASTIVDDPHEALHLLEHRRRVAGPTAEVKCGLLEENVGGRRLLETGGWSPAWSAPRLIRGQPLTWDPSAIWGQFNFALG